MLRIKLFYFLILTKSYLNYDYLNFNCLSHILQAVLHGRNFNDVKCGNHENLQQFFTRTDSS